MKNRILCAAAILITLGPVSAIADPITFVFNMPAFDDPGFALFGQTSVLDITVDNGNNSAINQSYLNTQITSFSVTIGALMASVNIFDDTQSGTGSIPYITTDMNGLPTLDLSAMVDSYYTLEASVGNLVQLGTNDSSSIAQYAVRVGEQLGVTRTDVVAVGTGPIAVSEPGTFALLGIGLFGMGLSNRKSQA